MLGVMRRADMLMLRMIRMLARGREVNGLADRSGENVRIGMQIVVMRTAVR